MNTEKNALDSSKWLKSPVTENADRLHAMQEVVLRPYYGKKKKLRLIRTSYILGSDASCDICINDPFISPKHAQLRMRKGSEGFEILDLGSKNGTYLNGIRIEQAPLPANGSLRLGRSSFSWNENAENELESPDWIFADPFMQATVKRLREVASTKLSVLLLGETGTGKEILARLLHQWSDRSNSPYVIINGSHAAGSLADSELFGHKKGAYTGSEQARVGALRSADGGTLFLDEVADIPPTAQVKLLRALESGEVKALGSDKAENSDFRLVSATSQDIESKIQEGSFRLDLYYRIAGITVHVPALRERPQDILAISKKVLQARGYELDRECEGKLLSYSWPGNVRELRAVLERAMISAVKDKCAIILPNHLEGIDRGGFFMKKSVYVPRTLLEMERDCIRESLERNGWSRSIAAKELGIARSTLFDKMRKFKIRDRAVIDC